MIRNCVLNGGWGFVALGSSDNIRIENCVIIRVDITTIGLSRVDNLSIRNSVITDNLAKKSTQPLVQRSHSPANNLFFLRTTEHERSVFGQDGPTVADDNREADVEPPNLVGDPRFVVSLTEPASGDAEETTADGGWFNDSLMREVHDFPDVFVTDPVLIERGIGLIPSEFADFQFDGAAVAE